MTAFLILLGLAGKATLAADVGIVQGVTLALLYSFSANARNLILNQVTPISAQYLLDYRLILLPPLAALAFLLARFSGVDAVLVMALLLRRAVEWLDEIFLSEMERTDKKTVAVYYLIIQALLLAFSALWLLADMPFPLLGVFSWALLPLALSGKFYWRAVRFSMHIPAEVLRKISPHIGSTAVIGITVYVFRLLLIDITGKVIAGDLFVAFAIGGVLGSVVANAFGPSVVLAQGRLNTHALPNALRIIMAVFFMVGITIILSSNSLHFFNKSALFWLAIGFSMIAAVPMVFAQIIRHRLLQNHQGQDLFGADVMMNVLLVALMPFVYYVVGLQSMAALYLLSSLLAWTFYKSYELHEVGVLAKLELQYRLIKPIFAGLMLFPIFFQLGHGIFHDTAMLFDANKDIAKLPIPVSILVSFAILMWVGAFNRARIVLIFVFFTFMLMIVAAVAGTLPYSVQQHAKFVLLAQFMLPMLALISGQIFEVERDVKQYVLEKSFFYVLILMVPLQILCSWLQGQYLLMPYMHVFSVYQHLHYVPIMFVSAYLLVFNYLWLTSKRTLLALTILMAVYVVMTASLFVVLAYFLSLLLSCVYIIRRYGDRNITMFFCLACLVGYGYWLYVEPSLIDILPISQQFGHSLSLTDKFVVAWQQKMSVWIYYINSVVNNPKAFWLGHSGLFVGGLLGGAHNYYLDFFYNFGLLGILPLLMLVGYTMYVMYANRRAVLNNAELFFPCMMLLFLIVVENSFYMGLRQPYSAILTFFLWGIVLSRLFRLRN